MIWKREVSLYMVKAEGKSGNLVKKRREESAIIQRTTEWGPRKGPVKKKILENTSDESQKFLLKA